MAHFRRITATIAVLTMLAASAPIALASTTSVGSRPVVASAAAARHFANCAALNKVYRHGVGKPGARDHTSGRPVTTFTVSLALYNANTGRDRDHDGIACEKR